MKLEITQAKLKLKLNNEVNINILSKIKFPKTTICLLDTTTNNELINQFTNILKSQSIHIITNNKGSTPKDITKLLVNSCTPNGNLNTDVLLLTFSPKYTNLIFKYIKPNYILINDFLPNITIPKESHLILNADNPNHQNYIINNPYTLYGIEANKNIYKNEFSKDNQKCPKCNQNLTYDYYYNDFLGKYYCQNCNLKRLTPSIKITKIDIKKNILIINDIYKINLTNFNITSIYNILSTITLASLLSIDFDAIITSLQKNPKEITKYNINKRIVYVLNTNSINNTLIFVKDNKELKTLIIDLEENKNLYDTNFEILNNNEIDKIICTGDKSYDIATRIKYSNINEDKIVVIQNIEESVKYIKTRTEGNIYAILKEKDTFNQYMKGI